REKQAHNGTMSRSLSSILFAVHTNAIGSTPSPVQEPLDGATVEDMVIEQDSDVELGKWFAIGHGIFPTAPKLGSAYMPGWRSRTKPYVLRCEVLRQGFHRVGAVRDPWHR